MKLFTKKDQPHFTTSVISLLCVLSLWLPSIGHAYSVETGHAPLTEAALKAYETCFPKDSTFAGDDRNKNRLHLQLANIAMDKGSSGLPYKYDDSHQVHMLFDYVIRLTNWHFYNPKKNDEKVTRRWLIEQSQRRLWQRAIKGFESMEEAEDKALFLGALVHFVEDVTVPAHVVPVYHGPFIPWIFGDFKPLYQYLIDDGRTEGSMVFDAIDKLAPDTTWILEQFTSEDSPACAEAKVANDDPDRIRRQLAQATLDALQTQIENCKGAKWNIFWNGTIDSNKNDSDKNKYFEAYNTKVPEFIRHGKIVDTDDNYLCTMREGDQRYRQFLFDRHLDAVKADLRLLRWASQNMPKKPRSPRKKEN